MSCMCFCLRTLNAVNANSFFLFINSLFFFLLLQKSVLCFMPPLKLERFPIITFTWHLYGSNSLMQQQHFYYGFSSIHRLSICNADEKFSFIHAFAFNTFIIMPCLCYAHQKYNFS